MKQVLYLSPGTTKGLLAITIGEAIQDQLTQYGSCTLRCIVPTSSKYILPPIALSGFVEIELRVSPRTPPSSPASMFATNSPVNLIASLTKYFASILISSLLWATLLCGLYAAGLASANFVVLLTLLLTALQAISCYLLIILLLFFASGNSVPSP